MAITKPNYRRRKPRARRSYKRSYNITRSMKYKVAMRPVTVVRTSYAGSWTPATTTTSDFWKYLSFDIGLFPDIANYRAIFDQVRVNWIKLVMRPRYTNFSGNNTTDTTLPGVTNQGGNEVHVVIDPKSLVTPSGTYTSATLNNFLAQGNVKSYRGTRNIPIMIKYPCISDDINATTNVKRIRAPWHDISRTLSHFGAHVYVTDVNLTGNFGQAYDWFVTMSLSFKGSQ